MLKKWSGAQQIWWEWLRQETVGLWLGLWPLCGLHTVLPFRCLGYEYRMELWIPGNSWPTEIGIEWCIHIDIYVCMYIYIYTYSIHTHTYIYTYIYIYLSIYLSISKHIHEATWSVAGFRDFLISLPCMMECWNTSLVRFQHEKRLPGPRLSSCESHGCFFTKRCWRWMQDMLEPGMPPSKKLQESCNNGACKKRYFEPNFIVQLI